MITALYVGILSLSLLALSILMIRNRFVHKVSVGDGENHQMLNVIRGHSNFTEYVPMILILMIVLEISGEEVWVIHILGISMVLGRLLHAICFFGKNHRFRFRQAGMLLTFLPLLVGGVACLLLFV